jgi:hypothetical protein
MENNNSVCYVGIVTEVKAIEGADNIELVCCWWMEFNC